MSDLIDSFCAEYHTYNDISADRRVDQARVLREFEASLGDRDVEELLATDLRAYLLSLVEGGMAATTVRKRLNMIRPFATWLWQQKVIDAERLMELRDVAPPRGGNGRGRPSPYTRKQIGEFWRDLDAAYPWVRDGTKPEQQQERAAMFLRRWRTGSSKWPRVEAYFMRCQIEAIVALVLMGGLRRDEAFNVELEALHPDNEYIVIQGARKNRDAESVERPVPWVGGEQMRLAVGRWVELREELAAPHDFPWLSLYRQHRLTPMRHRKFEVLLTQIGRGYEYRRMRHTFATEALRSGMPIDKLQKVMGHARIQQTLAYAEILGGDVVRAATRASSDFSRAVGRDAA